MGIHNDALIIAGGANSPNAPVWDGGKKVWHSSIYVLEKDGTKSKWHQENSIKLTKALAYAFYIYPLIAIPTCVLGGYLFSMIFNVEEKNIEDLVYSKK